MHFVVCVTTYPEKIMKKPAPWNWMPLCTTYFRSVCEIVLVTTWHNFLLYVFTVQLKKNKVNGTDRARKELVIWFLLKILHGSRPVSLHNKLSTNVWINIHVQLEYGSVYGLQFNNKPLSPCIIFHFPPFWIPSFRPYFQLGKRSHVFYRSYSHWFH